MGTGRNTVRLGMIGLLCLAASLARAQDATFELMTEVVPRSPDFVFKDGAKVIRLGSKVSHFLVTRVEGDRVRIVHDGREGDARKSDLVPADQAEAYFSDQIKANPQSAFNYLMRGVARAERRLPERVR